MFVPEVGVSVRVVCLLGGLTVGKCSGEFRVDSDEPATCYTTSSCVKRLCTHKIFLSSRGI